MNLDSTVPWVKTLAAGGISGLNGMAGVKSTLGV